MVTELEAVDVDMVDVVDSDDGDDIWEKDSASGTQSDSGDGAGLTSRNLRLKTVYDAVAGRIRVREPRTPKYPGAPVRQTDTVLSPEEALYRSRNAPERYEETDTYFAHEDLPEGALPDSDLVKAVHHYASQFYEALALRERRTEENEAKRKIEIERLENEKGAGNHVTRANDNSSLGTTEKKERRGRKRKNQSQTDEKDKEEGNREEKIVGEPQDDDVVRDMVFSRRRLLDERSMDETALLAFGILLEEAGREVLGTKGDLVFTEAAEGEEEEGDDWTTENEDEDSDDGNVVDHAGVEEGESEDPGEDGDMSNAE